MLTIHALLHLALLTAWFLAACTVGMPGWVRWALLAIAFPLAIAARLRASGYVRVAAVIPPLCALVGYGVLLGIFSRSPGLALAKCVAFAVMSIASLLGGASLVERFGRDIIIRSWCWIFSIGLMAAAVAAAMNLFPQGPEGLYGPTSNPNMFGSMIITLGVVLVAAVERDGARPWLILQVIVASILLLATRARTSIAAIIATAVAGVLLTSGTRRWAWAGGLLLAGGCLFVALPEEAVHRVADVTEGTTTEEVFHTRIGNWEESWNAMKAGLPMGLGWGVKYGIVRQWNWEPNSFGREEGTSWLPVGEELGIPGFLLVVWLWVSLARASRVAPSRMCTLGGATAVLYFVLASFEGWFLSPGSWECVIFWTSMGIMFARPPASLASPTLTKSELPQLLVGAQAYP